MEAAETFSVDVGTAASCRAFGVARSSLYRRRQPPPTVVRISACIFDRPALSDCCLSARKYLICCIANALWIRPPQLVGSQPYWTKSRYLMFGAHDVLRILGMRMTECSRTARNQRRHPCLYQTGAVGHGSRRSGVELG